MISIVFASASCLLSLLPIFVLNFSTVEHLSEPGGGAEVISCLSSWNTSVSEMSHVLKGPELLKTLMEPQGGDWGVITL